MKAAAARRGVLAALIAAASAGYTANGTAQEAASTRATVERIAWLGGCWEARAATRVQDEQWMLPRGGIMLGIARTTRGDTLRDYEHSMIEERDGGLVFTAMPSGQARGEFRSDALSDSLASFSNPAHDFPQRILYERRGADSLVVRVEGSLGGARRELRFAFQRRACG